MPREAELHPNEVKANDTLDVRLGCLTRCDGSAMLISRHGSVVSGVNGPVEAKERDQDPSGQIVQVTLHPPTGQQVGPVHRQIEETIRGLVENMLVKEAHPRCLVQVVIQPVELKYCITPLINCAILALLDAGVKLKHVTAAGAVALVKKEKDKWEMETEEELELIENPSIEQLEKSVARLHAVFNKSGKLLAVQSDGNFHGNLEKALHIAANVSHQLFDVFTKAVTTRLMTQEMSL